MTNTPNPTAEAVLREAAAKLLCWAEGQGCRHEDTHRGGVLWTICDHCGSKWADDQGGFQPYEEPAVFEELRAALATPQAAQASMSGDFGRGMLHAADICARRHSSIIKGREYDEAQWCAAEIRAAADGTHSNPETLPAIAPQPDTLDARTVELTDAECEVMARAFYNNGPGNVPYSTSYAGMRRAYAALRATAPQHKDATGVDGWIRCGCGMRERPVVRRRDWMTDRDRGCRFQAVCDYCGLQTSERDTEEETRISWNRSLSAAASAVQGDALVARDAVREVVREAHWAMEDCESGDYKYEGTDHEYVRLPQTSFTRLNNALDALEALIPESEQPALVGHAVTVLWPPAPAAQGDAKPVAWRWAYTMPDGRDALWYWGPDKPTAKHALYGMPIRVEPLYAAPRPASDDAQRFRAALEQIAAEHDAGRHDGLPEPCPALKGDAMWAIARAALEGQQVSDDAERLLDWLDDNCLSFHPGPSQAQDGHDLQFSWDGPEPDLRSGIRHAIARQPAKESV